MLLAQKPEALQEVKLAHRDVYASKSRCVTQVKQEVRCKQSKMRGVSASRSKILARREMRDAGLLRCVVLVHESFDVDGLGTCRAIEFACTATDALRNAHFGYFVSAELA